MFNLYFKLTKPYFESKKDWRARCLALQKEKKQVELAAKRQLTLTKQVMEEKATSQQMSELRVMEEKMLGKRKGKQKSVPRNKKQKTVSESDEEDNNDDEGEDEGEDSESEVSATSESVVIITRATGRDYHGGTGNNPTAPTTSKKTIKKGAVVTKQVAKRKPITPKKSKNTGDKATVPANSGRGRKIPTKTIMVAGKKVVIPAFQGNREPPEEQLRAIRQLPIEIRIEMCRSFPHNCAKYNVDPKLLENTANTGVDPDGQEAVSKGKTQNMY
jgi:hypothetical protein